MAPQKPKPNLPPNPHITNPRLASSTSNHPNPSKSMQRRLSMQISTASDRKGVVNSATKPLLGQSTNGTHSQDSKKISTPAVSSHMTSPPRPQPPTPVETGSVEITELKKEPTQSSNVDEAIEFVKKNLSLFRTLFSSRKDNYVWNQNFSELSGENKKDLETLAHIGPVDHMDALIDTQILSTQMHEALKNINPMKYMDALIGSNSLLE